jgi:hypothetical protein
MNKLGKFIGNYTIKPLDDEGFIKVYFYETSILFDDNIIEKIIDDEKISKLFIAINNEWKGSKKEREDVLLDIMEMISENQEFFKDLFTYEKKIEYNDVYYNLLKSKKILIEIEQKEFEKNISKENIGNYYAENLKKINLSDAKFYKYKSENESYFFIMVINDKIKLGFGE